MITVAQATAAFEAWENDFRADPGTFMTNEEVAAMAVADVSEARAIYFVALLRQHLRMNGRLAWPVAKIRELVGV